MKIKKTLKGAGVLLIAAILLFTSIVAVADTGEEQNAELRFLKATNSGVVKGEETQSTIADPPLFSQLPYEPYEIWTFFTSCASPGYRVHDEYWDVAEPICDLHWWGLSLIYVGGDPPWQNCDPEGMCFQVIFWDSLLGQAICTYNEVCPLAISTGKFYGGYEMFYWETILDPCCDLIPNGWVSIQSYSSANNCWFLWAGSDDGDLYAYQEGSAEPDLDDDAAFELTPPGPPPVPKICCSAVGMAFGDQDPEANVTGQIKVCSCGDPMSALNWAVDTSTYPTWATWKVIPESGTDLYEPSCAVIDIEAQITDAEGDYTGKIKIYNTDDPTDFCEITTSVSVIVPRARTTHNLFILNLLQQFPALYLIIKAILGA